MAISQVSLSSAARQNLLALQNTAKLLEATQTNLSTGKKVNSALDDAASYFASEGFINSANDLSSLKDSMSTALQTIEAAANAIESLTSVVQQLQGIVNSALQTTDNSTRAAYATQYDALLTQLDSLANDATFNGTNLVNSISSQLKVNFNATNTTSLTVQGSNLTSSGMGVGGAQNSFASDTQAKSVSGELEVTSTNANLTGAAYSGTLDLTGRITGAAATSGAGAVITSSAADFNTSASMTSGADVTIGSAALLTENQAGNLFDQISGLTVVSGTAFDDADPLTATTIHGQFTADGLAGSDFDTATNLLTATADGEATLTIRSGQSIQIDYTQDGSAGHVVLRNDTGSDIVISLSGDGAGADDTISFGANGQASATLAYNLSGFGAVDYDGLKLADYETIGGSILTEAGTAGVGSSVSVFATMDGDGLAAGTTTQTGAHAYDADAATLSNFTATDIRVTRSGTADAAYTLKAGATMDVSGATEMTGTTTTVVADSLATAQNQLTRALTTLRAAASSLGNNNTLVQTRLDFTDKLITTLQTASDNLVLADTNEEGANLQALQAQSQLGIVALGISGDQASAILRLF